MIKAKSISIENKLLAALMLLFVLLFVHLGASSLWDLDEGLYAEIARGMHETGNYLTPHFDNEPNFDKPPLTYWTTALFYKMLGVSEFSARMSSAVFGILCVFIVYLLARKIANKRAGLVSALILASNFMFFFASRIGLTDTSLVFFITAGLYWFYIAFTEDRPIYYLPFWISLALGTMVKGPIAVIIPGTVIALYTREKVFRELKKIQFYIGLLLYFAIVMPWHIAMWNLYGSHFLQSYLVIQMFSWYAQSFQAHGGPLYYYIPVIALGFLPWSPYLPAAFKRAYLKWRKGNDGYSFLLIWAIVVFIPFSIAQTKLPGYMLPMFPAMSILVGLWWNSVLDKGMFKKYSLYSIIVFLLGLGMFALLKLGQAYLTDDIVAEYGDLYSALFVLPWSIMIISIICQMLFVFTKKTEVTFLLPVIIFVSIILVVNLHLLPYAEEFKPVKPLVLHAMEFMEEEDVVLCSMLGRGYASTQFYARGAAVYLDRNSVVKFLKSNPHALLMIFKDDLNWLQEVYASDLKILYKTGNAALVAHAARD